MKQYFYRLNVNLSSKIKVDSAKAAVLLVNSLHGWSIGISLLMKKLDVNKIYYFNLPGPPVYSAWHLIYRRYEYEKPAKMIEKILKKFLRKI